MNFVTRLPRPRIVVSLMLFFTPAAATAQTWEGNREGPSLSEILVVDTTGEQNWLWGFEDVAGDGPAFSTEEQAIDARTAYVTTDAGHFYSRVYFSVAGETPGNVTTFVFIDSDENSSTGGHALYAPPTGTFATDPTNGGYDSIVKVEKAADGTLSGSVWQFDTTTRAFNEVTTRGGQIVTESGLFEDPIRFNQRRHGYIQSSVELDVVRLTRACHANIFVRTVNQAAGLGIGDSSVGEVAQSCVPQWGPNNVPVVVNPPTAGCTSNAECESGGVCTNGVCLYPQACVTNANCPALQACLQGRCVPVGGTGCADSSTCNGLLCERGRCVACASDASCGAGFVCATDGRCSVGNGPVGCTDSRVCDGLICANGRCAECTTNVSCGSGFICDSTGRCLATTPTGSVSNDAGTLYLAAGERLQGGACACTTGVGHNRNWSALISLLGAAALLVRSHKREQRG